MAEVESNADRRRGKLERQRRKNFIWLVSTTARARIKMNECERELKELGFEPDDLFHVDFDDETLLPGYAQMVYSEE